MIFVLAKGKKCRLCVWDWLIFKPSILENHKPFVKLLIRLNMQFYIEYTLYHMMLYRVHLTTDIRPTWHDVYMVIYAWEKYYDMYFTNHPRGELSCKNTIVSR